VIFASVVTALFVTACSGSKGSDITDTTDSGASSGPLYTLDDVCERVAPKICELTKSCCDKTGGFDQAGCIAHSKATCAKDVADVSGGRATFTPEKMLARQRHQRVLRNGPVLRSGRNEDVQEEHAHRDGVQRQGVAILRVRARQLLRPDDGTLRQRQGRQRHVQGPHRMCVAEVREHRGRREELRGAEGDRLYGGVQGTLIPARISSCATSSLLSPRCSSPRQPLGV
jgi:hypothetical protein